MWGLGPDLPRRLPLWIPISAASEVISAEWLGKLLLLFGFVGAWIGMKRLLITTGELWATSAAAIYAFSPFVITRAAVGHFMVTVPYAVLPWVLSTMMRPGRDLKRTFLAAVALGFAGHFGGSLALVLVGVAWLAGDRVRWLEGAGTTVVAQLPWLVPGLTVRGAGLVGSASFRTVADGPAGFARLSAGGGFWNTYFQAGGAGIIEAVIGAGLLALAVYGTPALPSDLRRPLIWIGLIGWIGAAASAVVGLRHVVDVLTDNPVGALWREPHRLLVLHLMWLAPSATLGARRLHSRISGRRSAWLGAIAMLPAVAGFVLAAPSAWGIGGQLEAHPIPADWRELRSAVQHDRSTVLVLPWFQYFNMQLDGGRVHRVLNPMPLYLGGDVLASSSNGLDPGVLERAEPRERKANDVVRRLERGEPIDAELRDLGVGWIVRLNTPMDRLYRSLPENAGIDLAIEGPNLSAYRVQGESRTTAQPRWRWAAIPSLCSQLVWISAGLLTIRATKVSRTRRFR